MGEFEKLGFDVEVKDADSAVKHLQDIANALERIQNATKGGIKSKSITDALGGGKKGSSSRKPKLTDEERWDKQYQDKMRKRAYYLKQGYVQQRNIISDHTKWVLAEEKKLEKKRFLTEQGYIQEKPKLTEEEQLRNSFEKSKRRREFGLQEGYIQEKQSLSEVEKYIQRVNAEKDKLNDKTYEEARRIDLANQQRKKEIDQRLKQELGIKEQTKSLGSYIAKMSSAVMLAKKLAHFMTGAIQESANYVENLNLFAVAYGETYQETIDWALNISKAYGLANNEIVKFAGTFRQLSTSLGIVGDTATSVSKTVTELGYDLSALFNTSVENAMEKLQSSVFSGNVRPLRAYGIDISQNQIDALFETSEALASLGVNSRNLSQSDKVLARLIITLRDGSNAFGTMNREINTLQSQIRIFQGSLSNFKLAVGDLIAEPLRNALVFVNAFIIAITNLIRAIKPLQKTDENNAINGLSESAETAIEEMEQLNGKLAGFDKFNTLQTGSGDGGASNVTSALTEELAKQQAKYAETQEAMSGVKNEAVELADTLTKLLPVVAAITAVKFYKWTQSAMTAASAAVATGDSISKLTTTGAKLGKVFTPKKLGIFAIAAGLLYLYSTNEDFRESMNRLFSAVVKVLDVAVEPLGAALGGVAKVIEILVNSFGGLIAHIANFISWVIEGLDKIGLLKGTIIMLGIAFASIKILSFTDKIGGAVEVVLLLAKKIGTLKTSLNGMKSAMNTTTTLIGGIVLLAMGVSSLANAWGDMSGWHKALTIIGAVTAAIIGLVVGIKALTLGIPAAIGLGAALAGSVLLISSQVKPQSYSAHADGGYTNANLIMTHENGKREWVGKAAGSSAIVNDTQMSDIMRSAVGQGVFDALKANRAISGSGSTSNETIVVKIGEEAVFNAVRKTAKKRGAGFAGI